MPRLQFPPVSFLPGRSLLTHQHSMRNLSHKSAWNSKTNLYNAIPLKDASGRKTISLLDELFPSEKSNDEFALELKKERHVPRHNLDTSIIYEHVGRELSSRPSKQISRRYLTGKEAIVVLRNGGKTLVEDDFVRILPSGDHIEGWRKENETIKVLPERNQATMQKTGVYYILFPNLLAAEAYRTRVERIHDLSRNYSLDSRTAPLPPAPNLDGSGQNLHSLLQSYALVPPSQDIKMQVLQFPLHYITRNLIENEGYDAVIRDRRSMHEVMIAPDGFRPSILTMKQALHNDYKERALQWATVGPNSGIRIMDLTERSNEGSKQESAVMDSGSNQRRSLPTFVISLADDAEAKRFVAAWHRRDIASLIEPSSEDEQRAFVVNAEILW